MPGAIEAFGRLVSRDAVAKVAHAEAAVARVRLASGELVLREGASSRIFGVVLGVPSLAATRAALEGNLSQTDEGVVWLDAEDTRGLRLGFAPLTEPVPSLPERRLRGARLG